MMCRKLDKKIELKVSNVIASVTLDTPNVIVPEEEIELLRKYAYGEITQEEFLEIIKNEVEEQRLSKARKGL